MTATRPAVPALLETWTGGQSAPALTWYGTDGERVELSGRVLANWVTKAANLLLDEADVGPGTLVHLDLPMHWRTAVWALAVWTCGGTVDLPSTESTAVADVLVSTDPAPEGAPVVVAVALPALAREVTNLPAGALDGAAELMAQPDVLVGVPEVDPAASAMAGLTHAELGDPACLVTTPPPPGRYLLAAEGVAEGLRAALAIWLTGGQVVLVGDPEADHDHIGQQEGATALPS